MGPAVEIATETLERLRAAAIGSPQTEVCGLVFGDDVRITAVTACANVDPAPARRFEIDPAALLSAHRAARGGGPRVIGCYHSHPSGETEPSLTDARAAAPDGWLWLVVTGAGTSGWRAVARGTVHGRFVPVALRPTGCASGSAAPHTAAAE